MLGPVWGLCSTTTPLFPFPDGLLLIFYLTKRREYYFMEDVQDVVEKCLININEDDLTMR